MSVSTSAAFFDLLKESNALSSEQLLRAENLIGKEMDSRAAAKRIVKSDLLTRWQAGQLLKGSALLSLGKYVLLERLPWGSNHAIFLAKHPRMDRKVALNVLDRASSGRADSRESFIRDARAIATLDHRNLIHVYDIDEAEERCFLVMEHVEGRNLHDVVKKQGPMSIELAADVVRQIASGLSHAHENKLIHGGLRPTNVILEQQGTATVIDLGLSKFDDLSKKPAGGDNSKITSIADYLSPEQASGQLPTAAADIYSLGCIAYFLLAGQAPFARGSYAQRLQRHQRDKVPDVRKLRGDTPDGLAKIVSKMMAKDPTDRHATSKEIVGDVEKWWNEFEPTVLPSKPKPAASAKPPADRQRKAPTDRQRKAPTDAAAPPPKKNSKPTVDAATEAPTKSGGFPGINTGKATSRKSANPASAPAVATKNNQPTKAAADPITAAQQATVQSPSPDAKPSAEAEPSSKKGLPLPWILGAAGALLLLLILGGGGLGAYLYLARSGDTDAVAQADGEAAHAIDDGSGEANGQTDDEANPADGEGDNGNTPPDGEPELPVPNGGAKPGEGEPSEEEQDGSEPGEGEQGGNEPGEGGGEKPDAEPEPEPPKTEPPKGGDNEEPPKKENPFRALAKAALLPPISDQTTPVSLGTVHVPEEIACYIDLLGSEQTAPKEKGVFTLNRARNGLADREWELSFDDEENNSEIVAMLELKGDDLQFQWTAAAAEQKASAYLCNCVLNLRTSDNEAYLALRKPKQVRALVVNLERPVLREKIEIPQVPEHETLMVEITKVVGSEKVSFVPKQSLAIPRDSIVAWWNKDEPMLGFKIDTAMQKDLQLTVTAVVDGNGQIFALNDRRLAKVHSEARTVVQRLGPQVEHMKKNRKKFKNQLPAAEQKLTLAKQTIEKFEKLKAEADKANGAAIQFRVYRRTDEQEVDILQGTLAAEPAE